MQAVIFITIILFFIYAALIIYYRQSFLQLSSFSFAPSTVAPSTTISVIIAARNEEKNITACINAITNQSYPKNLFEIIVVDDFSTDDTPKIILNFKNENVKLISLKDFVGVHKINAYKKKAIEIAIQQATGKLIVCTDADCIAPKNWLQTIAAFYQQKNPDFIVMPVALLPPTNKDGLEAMLINIFQSLDFMTLQGITAASVYKKMYSMCNGANLAYTKNAFNNVNGFAGIDTIASGDDMLLMHKIFKQNNNGILFLKCKDVIVQTQAQQSIRAFFNQRIRWASKADKYDDKRIFWVLLLVYFFNCLLMLLPLIAIFKNGKWPIIDLWLILLFLKIIVEFFFIYPVAKFFHKTNLLWWFAIMQPFHILYTVIAGWLGKFGNYSWKGRNVK